MKKALCLTVVSAGLMLAGCQSEMQMTAHPVHELDPMTMLVVTFVALTAFAFAMRRKLHQE